VKTGRRLNQVEKFHFLRFPGANPKSGFSSRSELVMRRTIAFAAALGWILSIPGPTSAQRGATFRWVCDLDGAPGQLTAQVEAVTPAGVFLDASGLFAGSIPTNEVNYYYEGTLVSATARYHFSGENAFADFTDMITNARFHVQFVVQGPSLLLIANPEGPQPARYLCQMAQPPR
jgi:hypothetical protein